MKDGSTPTDTMRVAVARLKKSVTFYYADFHPSPHQELRIQSVLETLVLEKQVALEEKFDKTWLGTFYVARVVRTMYEDAIRGPVGN